MIAELLPIANFALNLVILPLAKWMWDIRVEVTRINGRLNALEDRMNRIDGRHDALDLDRIR